MTGKIDLPFADEISDAAKLDLAKTLLIEAAYYLRNCENAQAIKRVERDISVLMETLRQAWVATAYPDHTNNQTEMF